jgi:type I restriction enzyme S subunit
MVDIEGVNPFYVAYFVATRTAQSWLTGVIKGAAYKGINLSDLRELKIPDVGDALQGRLVAELDDIAGSCASLAATCQSKLEDVDHLRQSLLQKAFAGELT